VESQQVQKLRMRACAGCQVKNQRVVKINFLTFLVKARLRQL
jgi:hypothetical protein